ncbi:IS3 family transposase [Acidimicrobiaceae bacterium USS-CC1]|uniref:IS3 family transposase n=1 Tax=Acidiferrimicrobium australe TaxID=2664430 RepID=A0ABW9QQ05_9ACTN|nr:IS3 family transposase [Acidiferrimicrobium australe]
MGQACRHRRRTAGGPLQRRAGGAVPAAAGEPPPAGRCRPAQASDGFLREGDPVKLDGFIEAEEAAGHSVKHACELFEVSRSAYYARKTHTPSPRAASDAELLEAIRKVHADSDGTYGAPRVHHELLARQVACGRRRVRRLMRIGGLEGRCKRRWRKTTIQDPAAEAEALDLIRRAFGPGRVLDARYVGDITYIPTWEGWAYLATVIDLASRRVVGWAIADHMRTELISEALLNAFHARRPAAGVIFHSDRGCQYTSRDYRQLAVDHGVTLSLGRKGTCWDNAVAESFFATIKRELIDRRSWPTVAGLRRAVFDWIEGWYNTRRLHSTLGYLSPADYEARIHHSTRPQAA